MSSCRRFLSASQAADALGVSRPTLYAYVSRGQLRSEPSPGGSKERRYYREDVDRLQQAKSARRDPQDAAARGLHWGGAVLESGITLIDGGRLYYRGRDAVALAETLTLEETAARLWETPEADRDRLFAQPPVLTGPDITRINRATGDPVGRLQIALAIAAGADAAALDLRPAAVRRTGARIVQLLASVVTGASVPQSPVHRMLQQTWAPRASRAGEVIRSALVLCADHELNISAFTARCVASAGASPYAVVSAALAALTGFKHGGASARARAMLDRARSAADAREDIVGQLRHGEMSPGFGHPLYPDGDPRAVLLLRLARGANQESAWRSVQYVSKAASALLHQQPNLDFGLAAIAKTYGLPEEAPLVLFALGRTLGWIAHAMEEYASGQLIRPRARYVGPPPAP